MKTRVFQILILFLMTALFLPTAIIASNANEPSGIFIYENPANEKAEFDILTPEAAEISVLIYDNQGNVLFSQKGNTQIVGNTNSLKINWNLTNRAGKRATAGIYIIQATARSSNGSGIHQYFAQLGVRK